MRSVVVLPQPDGPSSEKNSKPLSRLPNMRGSSTASPIAVSETIIISVPIALIVGSSPNRIADQILTGSGCASSPVVKNDSTKSSNEKANTRRPAATTAGQSAGISVRRTDCQREAPRSIAASSTSSEIAAIRARTTIVTYEIENVMCASTIVQNESCTPSWEKMRRAEMPATISGVTSGTSIRMFAPGAHLARARTRPMARAVPITTEASIVSSAICSDMKSDSRSSGLSRKASYQVSENPSNETSDLIELKLKRMTTTIGANRKR
jgi:hypothetical protein